MQEGAGPHLDRLCADVAAELDEVSSATAGGAVVYARGNAEFARVTPTTLEVRLPSDIAEAALRTTDTTALPEPGWIRFQPADDERHVTDRAAAWFQTAWRHATS